MVRIILILFFSLLMFMCTGQKKADIVDELVCPFPEGVPFILKRDDVFLHLSDKLGQNVRGLAGLSICIDSLGGLIGFKVLKMKEGSDDDPNIDYTANFYSREPCSKPKEEYPVDMQQYYPYIQQYVLGLGYERNEKVPLKSVNEMVFIVRLK